MNSPLRKISARKRSLRFLTPADFTVFPSIVPLGMTLSSVVYWRLEGWSDEVVSSGRFRTIGARIIVVRSTAPVTVSPGIKKFQNLNPSIPFSIMSPLRTRFVEVPMRVIVPPATAANERGMRNLFTFQFRSWALDFSKGMSTATTGVLLMNPLKAAVMRELLIRIDRLEFPSRSIMRWKGSVFFRIPVRAIRAITVRMEGLTAAA